MSRPRRAPASDANVEAEVSVLLCDSEKAAQYEEEHVHKVYDTISAHFSETRYKPWPMVKDFVSSLQCGSILFDIGSGNGKNCPSINCRIKRRRENDGVPTPHGDLFRTARGPIERTEQFNGLEGDKHTEMTVREQPHVFGIASDRSIELLKLAHIKRGVECVRSDGINLNCFRSCTADHCISIAVIHHFVTPERRSDALKTIYRVLKVGGTALVYVWAAEQARDRGGKDVLIDWSLPPGRRINGKEETHHLEDVNRKACSLSTHDGKSPLARRYYHLFVENELEALLLELNPSRESNSGDCTDDARIEIVKSYYDHENWCVIFKKIRYAPSSPLFF